jgi:CheY-like chemotaxis protein
MPLQFLIADDNPAHLKLTANVVLFLGGQSVPASDGVEAMQLVLDGEFDVVLLDLWMPRMGGVVAATRLLRELENRPNRPRIVAVTGDVSHERHALCRAVGMDGFITKPCDMDHLRRKLKEVVMTGHCWPEGPAEPILDVERLWSTLLNGAAGPVREFDQEARRIRELLRTLPSFDEPCIESAITIKDFALRYGFIRLARTMTGLIRAAHDGEQHLFGSQLDDEIRDYETAVVAAHESLHDARRTDLVAA